MKKSLFKHVHFDEIDSTSAYLIRERNNYENFTFVSTDYQTRGKGREIRKWISSKGANLLFSFLLKDKELMHEFGSISLACAATIANYLISKGFKGIQIKWPNDVYMDGKKICGILLEGYINEYIVVGIGLNINQEEFPDDLHHPATSLYLETNKRYEIETFRDELFECLYNDINSKNIQEKHYLNVINALDFLKGKDIVVEINGKLEKVKALGINEGNSLSVLFNGEKYSIISGEINFDYEQVGRRIPDQSGK